jgi:hypothetical protein
MKMNFTSFKLLIISFFIFPSAFAALGDYRSAGSGNWLAAGSWEFDNGATWIPAVATPTSADGVITIRTGHTITLDGPVTADQLTVDAGGALNINVFVTTSGGNNLTLAGTGTQLTVNGTLLLRGFNVLSGTGNVLVNGTFNWFSGTLSANTTTSVGSTTNLDLEFTKNLSTNFTNNGTFNWKTSLAAPGGDILLTNAVFTNNGTVNEQFLSDRSFANGGGSSFINNGTFNKTSAFVFSNNSVPITNSATGIIKGSGTLSINFGTMTNNGTLSPGASPGLLNINAGTVSAQNAKITIEVEDVLNLTTTGPFTTNLSTVTLNVTAAPTAPLQSYTILTTSGTFSGTFATANLPPNYTIAYNAASVVITKISAPLPAIWGDFKATSKNDKIQLVWNTLQEENTSYFVIEHSTDGRSFTQLATVPAAQNASSALKYSFIHNTPQRKIANYYRIKLYDLDGKTYSSQIAAARIADKSVVAVQATPNPFISNLQLTVFESVVDVRMVDVSGKLVKTLTLQPGLHTVDVSNLPAGSYSLLVYEKGKVVQTQTIIKQ